MIISMSVKVVSYFYYFHYFESFMKFNQETKIQPNIAVRNPFLLKYRSLFTLIKWKGVLQFLDDNNDDDTWCCQC